LAKLVHRLSGSTGRFVACSAGEIGDTLAQSILYGHMPGAFTGAKGRRTGIFEAAAGGTLLLDDIANLSTQVQGSMLRVLQERVFTPIGATRDIAVTCRELYATTQSIATLAEQGILMSDFLSRMGEMVVQVLPLRERPEDILPLAEYYLACVANEFEWKRVTLTPDVCQLFVRYPWPYNVRELKGVIERAVIHAHHEGSPDVTPYHLPARLLLEIDQKSPACRLNPELVVKTLIATDGNLSQAARSLGVHRNSLYRHVPAGFRRRTLSVDDPRL
jgi:DNA-binding NtrC family response regulator